MTTCCTVNDCFPCLFLAGNLMTLTGKRFFPFWAASGLKKPGKMQPREIQDNLFFHKRNGIGDFRAEVKALFNKLTLEASNRLILCKNARFFVQLLAGYSQIKIPYPFGKTLKQNKRSTNRDKHLARPHHRRPHARRDSAFSQ